MFMKHCSKLMAGALMLSLTAGAFATTAGQSSVTDQLNALRSELDAVRNTNRALQSQVAQLRSTTDENWLNENRAEQVKSLVKEVLADADTRASLLENGMSAGYNGHHFYLASEDGSFLLTIGGQIQIRLIANFHQGGDAASVATPAPHFPSAQGDDSDSGFQIRRMKLKFKGHIGNPKIKYDIVLAGSRSNGNAIFEDVKISYNFGNGWTVAAGLFKLPFLRQELTSSSRQLAVDRGLVTEFFTLNRSEQVQLSYKNNDLRFAVAVSDGANGTNVASGTNDYTDIGKDQTEFAVTARVDYRVRGDWKQIKDNSAWSGEELAIFLGGAIHYQAGDNSNNSTVNNAGRANYTAWTVDGSVEQNGLSVFAALMGAHIAPDNVTPALATPGVAVARDLLGALVQAGYMVIPDKFQPFVRWEWLSGNENNAAFEPYNNMQAVTFGLNWYFRKHDAKFTTDVVYVYQGGATSISPFGASHTSSGLGFSGDASHAEVADLIIWRLQFQLLF